MAAPKVFISSTCYDLSNTREQIRSFLLSLGYDPVMSEYSDVLYDPRTHTHTSCLHEVPNVDMIVLIIGSRFGGVAVPDAISEMEIDSLIKASYDLLGLITFFTTGKDESRAWTTVRGATAPIAGKSIHTDFRDKFIRAEVVAYDKLIEAGSFVKAKEKGWVRTEGKDYIVKDGDVIEFLI